MIAEILSYIWNDLLTDILSFIWQNFLEDALSFIWQNVIVSFFSFIWHNLDRSDFDYLLFNIIKAWESFPGWTTSTSESCSDVILEQGSMGIGFDIVIGILEFMFPPAPAPVFSVNDFIGEHHIEFLMDTFGVNPVVPVCGLTLIDISLIDVSCNNWYFMFPASWLLFDNIIEFPVSWLLFDNIIDSPIYSAVYYLNTNFENWCDYRLIFLLPSHVFIRSDYVSYTCLYFNDYVWLSNIVYPSLYKLSSIHPSWVQLYIPTFVIDFFNTVKYNIIIFIASFITYIFTFMCYIYEFLMMYIYNIGSKLEPIYLPYWQNYIYWVVRSFITSYWLFTCVFGYFFSIYIYQQCYKIFWYEGLEYWWEYFDLRIWRFFERSYYSTYVLNIDYSLNFTYSLERHRHRYIWLFKHIWSIRNFFKDYFRHWRGLKKSKTLPLAFEWYSNIYMKRRWFNHRRLSRMYIAFFWRFFFWIIWSWFTFMWRFCVSLLLRYAGILGFLHFYLYGIFYGMLWCWWIFSHEFCYNSFIFL